MSAPEGPAARAGVATVLRVVVWATLAAGAVAVWRQRGERNAIRRGERSRTGPAGDPPPSTPPGPLARAVADWLPDRPRTVAGRVAAGVWAAPLTAGGLVVGALGGGRPRWDDEHGCLLFDASGGLPARVLRGVGAGANAIGQTVISTYDPTPPLLLAHESGHVRQAERLGALLLPAYVWFGARYGYRDNPIERGARAAARAWRDGR